MVLYITILTVKFIDNFIFQRALWKIFNRLSITLNESMKVTETSCWDLGTHRRCFVYKIEGKVARILMLTFDYRPA